MCQFNISFSGDAESLITRAKQEIERSGGFFNGNAAQGDFQAKTPIGSIRGTYQIEGREISLAITKKPFLLSCTRIEKELTSVMQ
ncbi:MAG: hypothetical protein JWQ09_5164 [Segetibacter sp.]|nr:hypothetical protein [Segetibacter sp.]